MVGNLMLDKKGLTDIEIQELIDRETNYRRDIKLWREYFFTQKIREIILNDLLKGGKNEKIIN